MNVLPKNTQLGRLRFFEIYENFLGPKCFSVINELENLFLVYWSGDYDEGECTKWIYVPVSQKILDELLREENNLHNIFKKSKLKILVSNYSDKTKETSVTYLSHNELKTVNLPPTDFSIDLEEIVSIAPESKWDFNLKIAKRTDKHSSPSSNAVTDILEAFGDIVESLMKGHSKNEPTLHPLTAKHGSFDVKLGASDKERAIVALGLLGDLLEDIDLIEERLKKIELDPYRLKDLLDIVNLHSLELTLKAKTSSVLENPIVINSSKLLPVIKKLEDMSLTFIDSQKIPQANDLDRLISIVQHRINGGELIHEQIPGLTSTRQVRYYTHAAQCLGLLNNNLTPSAPGRILSLKSSKVAKYQFLADRVESSDFGWAWMNWAKVSNISELDPNTAETFIRECVKGLKRGTIPRRASTLNSWITVLKEYRREYDEPSKEQNHDELIN
ncbi:hypothetical protein QU232_000694 [Vibrio vulnificus]|uniref:DUF6575 domain-containing protein n=1 Tax=Vibrio vulnificus TaxID=672 RepID=UPI0009B6587F|nr:DUF6575 domain-containing protein [Vibrio vulnificus]EIU7821202.1 hypothetical protein [Vibrio vulnificus]EIY8040102.1 hypothetical protein [Vibrio vulnificus]ELP1866569.1 hypothetical protein [Vibrio vulnificus]OQK34314.1 hypothetical protein XM72_c21177 [Vibrio vulnificus]